MWTVAQNEPLQLAQIEPFRFLSKIDWHKTNRDYWHGLNRNGWHKDSEISGTIRTEIATDYISALDRTKFSEVITNEKEMERVSYRLTNKPPGLPQSIENRPSVSAPTRKKPLLEAYIHSFFNRSILCATVTIVISGCYVENTLSIFKCIFRKR